MVTTPTDIVNRALDECGVPTISDLEDGTSAARAALRIYDSTLRQLHAAAHWNFARKQMELPLVADRVGQYSANKDVPQPWTYLYEWPVDSVHARFVYRSSSYSNVNTDIFGPAAAVSIGDMVVANAPAPFLVASMPLSNPIDSSWDRTEGHDPEQTRVILTNQYRAVHVYTGLIQYPDAWDPLFTQAMVAVLAARLAMGVVEDKKLARVIRADNVALAKGALDAARVRDGDEGWVTQDHMPDWIAARWSGPAWYGPGVLYYPWVSMSFENAY